jgi:hypothetical protein
MLTLLGYIGGLLVLVGDVLIVIAAFRRGILWGLAVLFLPMVVGVVFVILHWRESNRGVALVVIGSLLLWFSDLRVPRTWDQVRHQSGAIWTRA